MNDRIEIELPKELHRRVPVATTPRDWIARYLAKLSNVRRERRPVRGWLDDPPLTPRRRARAVVLRFGGRR